MSKINKSKTYLLPLLSEFVSFEKKYYGSLKNTFIYDEEGKYKDCMFVVLSYAFKVPDFTKYEKKLINNELFVDFIDLQDKVVYIFKFPEEYMEEYNYFKEGRYSKYRESTKEIILSYFANIYRNNLNAITFLLKIKHILFKNEILKKKIEKDLNISLPATAELSDIMDEKEETFKLSPTMEKNDK